MSTPSAAPPPPDTTQGLSEGERLIDTFVAPSKTFADLRRNASWFAPFLIIAVVSLGFIFAIDKKIGWEQIMQNEVAKNPKAQERIDKLPPEQRDNILRTQVKVSRVFAYVSPVFLLVTFLVSAGVLLATFNFGFGAQLRYMTTMAIVTYASLPTILSALLGIVVLFAGVDPEAFNIRNPVATNPAYFMDPTANKFLYGVVSAFDVITLWVIFLMAGGISANSKVKKSAAFLTILILFLLFKVGAAALGAAFS
ncbi:MAG TPA: YIP1 family protein [Terriglobales bacterium]|nr:YIP1 family protein [Terriglobales bacterium]